MQVRVHLLVPSCHEQFVIYNENCSYSPPQNKPQTIIPSIEIVRKTKTNIGGINKVMDDFSSLHHYQLSGTSLYFFNVWLCILQQCDQNVAVAVVLIVRHLSFVSVICHLSSVICHLAGWDSLIHSFVMNKRIG